MDLKLSHENGVGILEVSGEVSAKELSILKSGIAKLLKDGKDKIILDLESLKDVPAEFVAQISEFDTIAKELLGSIVLAGVREELTKSLAAISDPPPLKCFADRKLAQEYFEGSESEMDELPESVVALIGQKDKQIEALENQLSLTKPEEMTKLRTDNQFLMEFNKKLEGTLGEYFENRRLPCSDQAAMERIKVLETEVKNLSTTASEGEANVKE